MVIHRVLRSSRSFIILNSIKTIQKPNTWNYRSLLKNAIECYRHHRSVFVCWWFNWINLDSHPWLAHQHLAHLLFSFSIILVQIGKIYIRYIYINAYIYIEIDSWTTIVTPNCEHSSRSCHHHLVAQKSFVLFIRWSFFFYPSQHIYVIDLCLKYIYIFISLSFSLSLSIFLPPFILFLLSNIFHRDFRFSKINNESVRSFEGTSTHADGNDQRTSA